MHTVDEAAKKVLEGNGFKFNFLDGWFQIVARNDNNPRAKTVYEKINVFKVVEHIINGNRVDIYTLRGDKYCLIEHVTGHTLKVNQDSLYIKTEKEIDWKDIVSKFGAEFDGDSFLIGTAEFDNDGFIKMCHEVAELTDNPE